MNNETHCQWFCAVSQKKHNTKEETELECIFLFCGCAYCFYVFFHIFIFYCCGFFSKEDKNSTTRKVKRKKGFRRRNMNPTGSPIFSFGTCTQQQQQQNLEHQIDQTDNFPEFKIRFLLCVLARTGDHIDCSV